MGLYTARVKEFVLKTKENLDPRRLETEKPTMGAEILEISELPPPLREAAHEFLRAVDAKDGPKAREVIGPVLEHYVNNGREIPWDLEMAYVRLYAAELIAEARQRKG
jgi:hypothetical protein